MTDLGQGAVIAGKYRLDYQIGRGGMGSVWAARHLQLDTQVAIKFIDPVAETGDARLRFEREAKAAAQLRSPHVVQILDHGVDGDRPYIAMELLDGEDLGERLRREKRISVQAAAHIFTQAAKALRRAHDAGVIHRDLKPSNIFLARFDDDEVVKLLDFGVAKIRDPSGDMASAFTQTGVIFGSPAYMSPEQARGARVIDHRSDLWSLAVILFRAITGVKPFEASSIGDLVIKLCIDPLPVASHFAPDLSPDIDRFFERAFAREPEHRFPSAVAMAAAFEAIANPGGTSQLSRSSLGTLPGSLMTSSASLPQYTLPEVHAPPRAPTFSGSLSSPLPQPQATATPQPQTTSTWGDTGPSSERTAVMTGYPGVATPPSDSSYEPGLVSQSGELSIAPQSASSASLSGAGTSSLTVDPPPAPPSMTPSPATKLVSPSPRAPISSLLSLPQNKLLAIVVSLIGGLVIVLVFVLIAASRGTATDTARVEAQHTDPPPAEAPPTEAPPTEAPPASAEQAAPSPAPESTAAAEPSAQATASASAAAGAVAPQAPPSSKPAPAPSTTAKPTVTGRGQGSRPQRTAPPPSGTGSKGGKKSGPNFGY